MQYLVFWPLFRQIIVLFLPLKLCCRDWRFAIRNFSSSNTCYDILLIVCNWISNVYAFMACQDVRFSFQTEGHKL